ncbi:MAG: hypothetical protein J3K34DRAFT_197222 [Monoraphidium minutum]|nr:MAG: hypothetical protein J3K34DRAFT_197222 [Monoraphidium minutum]
MNASTGLSRGPIGALSASYTHPRPLDAGARRHAAGECSSSGAAGACSSSSNVCGTPAAAAWRPGRRASSGSSGASSGGRRRVRAGAGAGQAPLSVVGQAAAGKPTVAITGATGLIGSRLASKLAAQGHRVRVLTRDVGSARGKLPYPGLEFYGPQQWAAAVVGAGAVVNLAGTPIGTRWTPEIKRQIKASRLDTTTKIAAAITAAPEGLRPSVFLSSSAVGYYGSSSTGSFTEESPAGRDYLAGVCEQWEAAAQQVPPGVRVVIVRTGIVLARDGGVLGRMLPMFDLFAGGPLGTGKQWMSWIHRDDLVDLMVEGIKNPAYVGTYNGTAPKPVTMAQLCTSVGGIMGRPSWMPVPDYAVSALLGEGAQVVLEGQRVLPSRTQQQGFRFKYGDIDAALRQLLR